MYVIYKGHNLEFQAKPWENQEILLEEEKMPTQITQKGTWNEERLGLIRYICHIHQYCTYVCSSINRTLSLTKLEKCVTNITHKNRCRELPTIAAFTSVCTDFQTLS
jgi:hypothetical protein